MPRPEAPRHIDERTFRPRFEPRQQNTMRRDGELNLDQGLTAGRIIMVATSENTPMPVGAENEPAPENGKALDRCRVLPSSRGRSFEAQTVNAIVDHGQSAHLRITEPRPTHRTGGPKLRLNEINIIYYRLQKRQPVSLCILKRSPRRNGRAGPLLKTLDPIADGECVDPETALFPGPGLGIRFFVQELASPNERIGTPIPPRGLVLAEIGPQRRHGRSPRVLQGHASPAPTGRSPLHPLVHHT